MNLGGTLRLNKFACFSVLFVLFLIVYWQTGTSGYPADKTDLVNLKSLLKASIRAAELGGRKVVDAKQNNLHIKSKGKTKEGVNDPVTDADFASHCVMYYSLKKTFPKVSVVSEEHNNPDTECENQEVLNTEDVLPDHMTIEERYDELVMAKDVTIWIDPLDATKEYTEGLYEYVTTMVCVAVKGVPVIGVIHEAFKPSTSWGWFTKAGSRDLPSLAYNATNKLHPRVTISMSHAGEASSIVTNAYGPETKITPAAGAGYKVLNVARGKFDVYIHTTLIKKWDLCAGDAIIKTVGGKMTTAKGDLIKYTDGADVKVSDGLVVSRFDHDYYLSKMPVIMSGH